MLNATSPSTVNRMTPTAMHPGVQTIANSVTHGRLQLGRSFAEATRLGPIRAEATTSAQDLGRVDETSSTGTVNPADHSDEGGLTTTSEDEAIMLADRPLDPGDSMYRGRIPTQSRIHSTSRDVQLSPIRTRRRAREKSLVQIETIAQAAVCPSTRELSSSEEGPIPTVSTQARRRKIKASPFPLTSDDEVEGPSRRLTHERPGHKAPRDTGLVSGTNLFVDSEAEDTSSEVSDSHKDYNLAPDEYDYSDPFIDDSNVCQGTPPTRAGLLAVTNRQQDTSDSSDEETSVDNEFMGIDEPDPVQMALDACEARRIAEDEEMEAVRAAAERHRMFLSSALELLAANEGLAPHDIDDEDRQVALATRQSLVEELAMSAGKRRRMSFDTKKINGKGKGKGVPTRSPLPSDSSSGDEECSEEHGREHKRLRHAMELSRRSWASVHAAHGESSSQPTAGATTSSSSAPDLRTKRGVRELIIEAAEGHPVGGTLALPRPPNTFAAGAVEVRLLDPPATNEVLLDMSDCIIRVSSKGVLYNLSAKLELRPNREDTYSQGLVRFSGWADQCPEMDGELALAFLVFRDRGQFGNLARMDISKVFCLRDDSTSLRYHAVTHEGAPYVLLSTGFCLQSQLASRSRSGLSRKYITVIPHEGEHQRMASAACTVFGLPAMRAAISKGALEFSTRTEARRSSNNNIGWSHEPVFPADISTAPGLGISPSKVVREQFSLAPDATIPVYDARDAVDFEPSADLGSLDVKLPRWKGDVPMGSFVVVGYTMTAVLSQRREWTLVLNIQWVIIVGLPGEAQA